MLEVLRPFDCGTRHDDRAPAIRVERAGRVATGGDRERARDARRGDVMARERAGVEHDLIFQTRAAEGGHPPEPGRTGEDRHQGALNLALEVRLVQPAALESVRDHRLHVRILDQRGDRADAFERRADALDGVVDQLQVVLRVARRIEVDLDFECTLGRVGARGPDAGQALQRDLQGSGDRAAHAFRRQVAGVGEDFDARQRDGREDALGRAQVSAYAERREHRD